MTGKDFSERGFAKLAAAFTLILAALVLIAVFFGRPLQRYIRESRMQRATSAHFEILTPPGAVSEQSMTQFIAQQESLFTKLARKLGAADAKLKARIIFDSESPAAAETPGASPSYTVSGSTIQTNLTGSAPQLDPAAVAQVLLQNIWGRPGNARIARWTAMALVGEQKGEELGMAAAKVDQRLGHRKVASLLDNPGKQILPEDLAILGAAWINSIVDIAGPSEIRKLYSTSMPDATMTEVTKVLDTTPAEVERKWQLWIYSYVAGMPAMSRDSAPPMNMPMPGKH